MENIVKKKSINIKIIILLAVLIVAIVFVLIKCFAPTSNRSVNISNYINVTYSGLQSRGKAICEVEKDKLYIQLAGEEKNTVVLAKIKAVIDSITVETNGSDLSNGDSVGITVSYDKASAKKVDCDFSKLKYSIKVSGLGDGKTIDIFENVEVVVAGISPEAYANVSNKWTEDDLKNISFTIQNPSNISKGDVVIVKCNASEEEMTQRGYILQSYSKEYKVDKVNSYLSDISQIDMSLLQIIKTEAADTIKSETDSLKFRMFYKATNDSTYLFQYNNEWVNNTELVKAVYLTKKVNTDVITNNYIYILFKANISNGSTTSDIYFAFEYPDGIITNDDKFTIAHNNQSTRYICGLNYDDILGRVITSKANSYTITEISGLK